MTRLIAALILITHALSSLSAAAVAGDILDPAGEHAGFELHVLDHHDGESAQHDEADHHLCHQNLIGMAISLPDLAGTGWHGEQNSGFTALLSSDRPDRLLRPPRV